MHLSVFIWISQWSQFIPYHCIGNLKQVASLKIEYAKVPLIKLHEPADTAFLVIYKKRYQRNLQWYRFLPEFLPEFLPIFHENISQKTSNVNWYQAILYSMIRCKQLAKIFTAASSKEMDMELSGILGTPRLNAVLQFLRAFRDGRKIVVPHCPL